MHAFVIFRAKFRSIPTPVKAFYFTAYASSLFQLCWVLKTVLAFHDELIDLRRERSILIEAVEECRRSHIKAQDVLIDSSQAQSTQALGISLIHHLFILFFSFELCLVKFFSICD